MTAAEKAAMDKLAARVDALEAKQSTYKTIQDVPDYWRADIQDLMDKKILLGTGNGELNLTKSETRMAVLIKRAMEKVAAE